MATTLETPKQTETVVDAEIFSVVAEHGGSISAAIERYGGDISRCPYIQSMGAAGVELVQQQIAMEQRADRGPTMREILHAKKTQNVVQVTESATQTFATQRANGQLQEAKGSNKVDSLEAVAAKAKIENVSVGSLVEEQVARNRAEIEAEYLLKVRGQETMEPTPLNPKTISQNLQESNKITSFGIQHNKGTQSSKPLPQKAEIKTVSVVRPDIKNNQLAVDKTSEAVPLASKTAEAANFDLPQNASEADIGKIYQNYDFLLENDKDKSGPQDSAVDTTVATGVYVSDNKVDFPEQLTDDSINFAATDIKSEAPSETKLGLDDINITVEPDRVISDETEAFVRSVMSNDQEIENHLKPVSNYVDSLAEAEPEVYNLWQEFVQTAQDIMDNKPANQKDIIVQQEKLAEAITEFAQMLPKEHAVRLQKLITTISESLLDRASDFQATRDRVDALNKKGTHEYRLFASGLTNLLLQLMDLQRRIAVVSYMGGCSVKTTLA